MHSPIFSRKTFLSFALCTLCIGLHPASLSAAPADQAVSPTNPALNQAAALGQLSGLAQGFANAFSANCKPLTQEHAKQVLPSGKAGKIKTCAQGGVKVSTLVSTDNKGQALSLPLMVEANNPAALRSMSKILAEMTRSAAVANWGQAANVSNNTLRYKGLAEACEEWIDITFHGDAIESVKWTFCAE